MKKEKNYIKFNSERFNFIQKFNFYNKFFIKSKFFVKSFESLFIKYWIGDHMDIILSLIVLAVIAFIVFAIARFFLRLAGRVIGCILTIVVAIGILAILFLFVF